MKLPAHVVLLWRAFTAIMLLACAGVVVILVTVLSLLPYIVAVVLGAMLAHALGIL